MKSTSAGLLSILAFGVGCSQGVDEPSGHAAVGAVAERIDAVGAVFTLTNEAANAVVAFRRSGDGSLTRTGRYATGGTGSADMLEAQGAVSLSADHKWLFAVNPGSSEVSSFSVRGDALTLIGRVSSGGTRPVSVTSNGRLVYVVNAGGNISGFTLGGDGTLTPLAGSSRPLTDIAANPAQIEFSPDGKTLVVTERDTKQIDSYPVGADGLPGDGVAHESSGETPYGFELTRSGRLIVSEAAAGGDGLGTISSYGDAFDFPLVTASFKTSQSGTCWVAVTSDGRFAYASNTGSGTISGFGISASGALTPLDPGAVTADLGSDSLPIDMALSADNRYLYALDLAFHTINVLRVEADGRLTSIPSGDLGPAFGKDTFGLAAY